MTTTSAPTVGSYEASETDPTWQDYFNLLKPRVMSL
ncbi:MAG: protoheme IX farnesyltransferase, partial [Alphaproteobacteria bacterium]